MYASITFFGSGSPNNCPAAWAFTVGSPGMSSWLAVKDLPNSCTVS